MKSTPDTKEKPAAAATTAAAESIDSPASTQAAEAFKRGQRAGVERYHDLMEKGMPRMNAFHKALNATRTEPGDEFSDGWSAGVRTYHAEMRSGFSRAEAYKLTLEKI